MLTVLGIETSCDETAAGIVRGPAALGGLKAGAEGARAADGAKIDKGSSAAADDPGVQLLANVVASSMAEHIKYGGVVPEIAARSHIEVITGVVEGALEQAGLDWPQIDAISVTNGAGLGGSLLIGVMTARTLAMALSKPLYASNHVMGHVYANFITNQAAVATGASVNTSALPAYQLPAQPPKFPMLAIIVSGGHSQLVLFRSHFDYTLLGRTQDDAIGEAFDKVAKITGLPYPGGPSVAQAALKGDPQAFKLPIAKMPGYDFSFSGLKTAVLRQAQALCGESYDFPSYKLPERLSAAQVADLAASFQFTACQTIADKAAAACAEFAPASVVLAGGVAASSELRRQLTERLTDVPLLFPDLKLCTDNGAMIASLGYYQAACCQPPADPLTLAIQPNLSM